MCGWDPSIIESLPSQHLFRHSGSHSTDLTHPIRVEGSPTMSFSALNQSEELIAQDAEEHTRELQIEEAFSIFQDALKLQKDSQFSQARTAYKALFAIDVFSGDGMAAISPALRTLRYLAHRNRGLLYFEELRYTISRLSTDEMFSLLDDAVDDLIEALQQTDGDTVLVNLLLSIFRFFGHERLSRFVVEYALTKEENEDLISHRSRRLQSRDLSSYSKEEAIILEQLKVTTEKSTPPQSSLQLPDVSFLQPLKDFNDGQRQVRMESRVENIRLERLTINDLCKCLYAVSGRGKPKSLSFKDTYLQFENVITSVKFSVPGSVEKGIAARLAKLPTSTNSTSRTADDEAKRPAPDDVPQRSSKRVRTQEDNDALFEEIRLKSQRFIGVFNSIVSTLGAQLPSYDLASADRTTLDFLNCLNSWSPNHTEYFLHSVNKSSTDVPLSDLLSSVDSYQDPHHTNVSITDYLLDVSSFINEVNGNSQSFPEVRLSFLKLLLSGAPGERCLITDCLLEQDAYSALEAFVFAVEKECIESATYTDDQGSSYLVSMFEMMVNHLIHSRENSQGPTGYGSSLHDTLRVWDKKLLTILPGTSILSLRRQWCFAMYLQHCEAQDSNLLGKVLHQLASNMSSFHPDLIIRFVNYDWIPTLSVKSIRNQADKLEVVTLFKKALEDESADTRGTISLLESMLLNTSDDVSQQSTTEKFVKESPLVIKLKLWKTLLDSYVREADLKRYVSAMDVLMPFLYGTISDGEFEASSEPSRHRTILIVLGYYGTYVEGLAMLSQRYGWAWPNTESGLFPKLMKFLGLLYCFCLYEHMGHTTRSPSAKPPTPSRSVSKLRDMIADTLMLIIIWFDENSSSDKDLSLDLLSVVHEEIGLLHFCDAASGRFLELSEHMLQSSDHGKFEVDILQHLNCRFHISISTEHFIPFNHESKQTQLSRNSAFQFSGFLFGLLKKKKDPLISQLKPDLKSAMDMFYDAIGDPDQDTHSVQRNTAQLKLFLEQPITMRLFRDAFWGSLSLDLKRVDSPVFEVAQQGLYYFQAAANVGVYKARKRLAQGKSTDLEHVIKLLHTDLISGAGRTETWLLLGESYSLLAEDDLVWTADRLNSIEKKFAVASIQRKSILCYCLALSSYVQGPSDSVIGAMIFGSFSRELYHSLMRPMDGFCCLVSAERKVLTTEGILKVKSVLSTEKQSFILKVAERLSRMSISCDEKSWINYFYLSKILHKLDAPPKLAINASLKACQLSEGAMEPHYQLCSLLFKSVRSKGYSVSKALEKLNQTSGVFDDIPVVDSFDGFRSELLRALRKLVSIDKKKWHHRPKYRAARILYEMGDYQRAANEMETFILLRSNNKTLVNIWKPEFEAPGKHFVYTFDYISFYLDISWKLADLQSLVLLSKKLRRFGSNMIDLADAWEKASFSICTLARQIANIPKDYTDTVMPKLVFSEVTADFEALTDLVQRDMDKRDIPLLVLIFEIQELRRMNNGFGPTSLVDDTLTALFLTFHQERQNLLSQVNIEAKQAKSPADGSPAVKARVAKRDVIAAVATMMKVIEDQLSAFKISEDVGFDVPAHLRNPDTRGYVMPDPDSEDGSGYQLICPPPVTPPVIEIDSGNETEDEFHTPTASATTPSAHVAA